jgi:hypothetical protein
VSGSRGKMLSPLIDEALAHSYQNEYTDEKLKEQIRFRASRYNLKDPDKIADDIFNNINYLKTDFEQYLNSLQEPDRIYELMEENGL